MRTRVGFAAAMLLMLGLTACGAGERSAEKKDAAQRPANKAVSAKVKITETSLGAILTDDKNRTLYAFTKDKDGASNCADDCIATWPALTASQTVAGDGVDTALLKKTARGEGTTQATYGEWPLYYYAGDVAPGDLNGQAVDGEWFVVKADGKLVKAKP